MIEINYVEGDATYPQGQGNKIIVHVCNTEGGWGAGFVLALSKRWREPEQYYRAWAHETNGNFYLGEVDFVKVEKDIIVANMIAQKGYTNIPIRYEALKKCLRQVEAFARGWKASVHGPRFGSGLSGGKWELIEPIIEETLCTKDIPVTIYDLPLRKSC